MAKHWSERLVLDGAKTSEDRIAGMLEKALTRPAQPHEVEMLLKLTNRSLVLRGASEELLGCQPAWQDAAHAVFNLKEFLYVR